MILDDFVDRLYIYDFEFEIITSVYFWINISYNLNKLNQKEIIVELLKAVKNIEILDEANLNDTEYKKVSTRLINKLYWFLQVGEVDNKNSNSNNKKLFDYKVDELAIYSAFYKTYGIDLQKEKHTLHWWKFIALFRDLDEDCLLKQYYMHYRNYDTSSKTFQSYDNKTKNEILKIINDVSLNYKENISEVESDLEKRRKKVRLEAKNGNS